MSLSAFIHHHHDEIIRGFEEFARTLMPPGVDMSPAELRDHAEEMLTAVVLDMREAQTADEQYKKSRGGGVMRRMEASGRLHADDRMQHGYSLRAVMAEFRALRASVLSLYEASGVGDLSEVRRFNEAIDEALTESMDRYAGQSDLFRDQFIGILSHDLRDPIGAITTGAALLALPEDNPERRGRVTTRILRSTQRMQRMIADLLDLTQARLGGAIPITRGRTDLAQLCDEVMVESQAAEPGIVLRWKAQGDLVGHWDADRLTQVVANLVGNAVQHGAGTPITLTARGEPDNVWLSVHNGGTPIPPEVLPFVFEPLARGNDQGASRPHSIGLGLFIACAVMSAHGGAIKVASSSEHGTTFTMRLPR